MLKTFHLNGLAGFLITHTYEGDHSLVLMISFKHLLVLNNLSESN